MPDDLVQQFFDRNARSFPKKTAFVGHVGTLSFSELFKQSNRLANGLRTMGIARQERVAFCLPRSTSSIVSILGILKADAVYVPVHPESAEGRMRRILFDCRPAAIICNKDTLPSIMDCMQGELLSPIVILGDGEASPKFATLTQAIIDAEPEECPAYQNTCDDLAYILYTSGSTGTPKGVMVSHSNINHYINWAINYFDITDADRILGTAPLHFDMSTFDVHCALQTGATLILASETATLFPMKLMALMEVHHVTIWKGVSSLLMYMARTLSLGQTNLQDLRTVIFAGEPLATKYLITWMEAYSHTRFYNAYGPTEATGISTIYPVRTIPLKCDEPIPIGKACDHAEVLILNNDNDQPVEHSERGELCIAGEGVSRGYWQDKTKTNKVFTVDPRSSLGNNRIYRTGDIGCRNAQGDIVYLGRMDTQVKSMGYRVDLVEIEHVLLAENHVLDAVVVLDRTVEEDPGQLVALVVMENGTDLKHLWQVLPQKLPKYMVPRYIFQAASIPRSDRGKIDRKTVEQLIREIMTTQ